MILLLKKTLKRFNLVPISTSKMLVQTFFVVVCVIWQVSGLPFISNSKETRAELYKAPKFLKTWKDFHIFPHWVTEIGEIGLFAIDYAWHHELSEHIEEVASEVSEINSKLDVILATSPAASKLFSQLSKPYHHFSHEENLIWDYSSSTPSAIERQIIR